ncbi:MAG: histidine kinase [Flavobacteriales bacterium]|nr:histidine kinase [Flavobacteriales bacterium]
MMRWSAVLFHLFLGLTSSAQYPFVRSFEVRAGQQRPKIHAVAQDAQGSIWFATDLGLIRSDLELTDVVLLAKKSSVTAIGSRGNEVYSAWSDGTIVRCSGTRCDTLFTDTVLIHSPVKALVRDGVGGLWIGTYGAGVIHYADGRIKRFGMADGLNDDHVNALCLVDEAQVAVATDQGVAVLSRVGIMQRIREQEGLPDNLVLALHRGEQGRIWAGTDRGGVFSFVPNAARPKVQVVDLQWPYGPVVGLVEDASMIWAATVDHGVVIYDLRQGLASYAPGTDRPEALVQAMDVSLMADASVLWCDGTDRVHRADPAVLYVPQHEGVDLRHINALTVDHEGRIWLATPEGIFHHAAGFADQLKMTRLALEQDPNMQVVCLREDAEGSMWAGTFGNGVFRIRANGDVTRFSEKDGLSNNSVLSIRTQGQRLWFATLAGICSWSPQEGFRAATIPGSGFVYDVLPLPDGAVLAATDGTGVVRVEKNGNGRRIGPTDVSASYYSLCLDTNGTAWACGPGTGLCRIRGDSIQCVSTARAPFDGNVFGIAAVGERVVAMGESGIAIYDPSRNDLFDIGASVGSYGITAELNTIALDPEGDLWLACDRGLIRMTPGRTVQADHVPCVITSVVWAGEELPLSTELMLRHDQNFLTFHFASPYLSSPENVRFQYRLLGFDPEIKETRDRKIDLSRLPPGHYRFELRAFLAGDVPPEEWVVLPFTIRSPWYRTPWAMVGLIILVSGLLLFLIRSREDRLRYRDRVEKEKARFQLDALRSQVNPHFLFNSFNTLIELIEEDQEKAVEHVEHLSEFFRNILQVRDKELIPVREELRLLDTYFYLEQRRFGERIALHTRIPEELRERLLPPLTLQLLVENAIKHNAATTSEPLVIEVEAVDDALEVSNPVRLRRTALPSTGFGVTSIRQRYSALTNRPVDVSNDGAYFRVRIPLIDKP